MSGLASVHAHACAVVCPHPGAQGGLGCLRIPLQRGVCGAAARLKATQLEPDVNKCPHHIACASRCARPSLASASAACTAAALKDRLSCTSCARSTQSEVVVPCVDPATGRALAVLDVDSDHLGAFDQVQWRGRRCTAVIAVRGLARMNDDIGPHGTAHLIRPPVGLLLRRSVQTDAKSHTWMCRWTPRAWRPFAPCSRSATATSWPQGD